MEVRQHAVADLELVWRIYEDIACARTGNYTSVGCRRGNRLKCAHGSRADAKHAPAARLACVDRVSGLWRNREGFEVHMMVLDILGLYGTKRAWPHMEGHRHPLDALSLKRCEYLRREMEAGGRRSNGSCVLGIDSLVALTVGALLFGSSLTLNIRRNRCVSERIQQVGERSGAYEFNSPHSDALKRLNKPRL